jgi:hypothetical protein
MLACHLFRMASISVAISQLGHFSFSEQQTPISLHPD